MDSETMIELGKILGAPGILAVFLVFMYFKNRGQNSVDHSQYVTQVEFLTTVKESRRLSDKRSDELLDAVQDLGKEIKARIQTDEQNLYQHVAQHPGPTG